MSSSVGVLTSLLVSMVIELEGVALKSIFTDNRLTLSLSRYIMEKVKDLQELVSLSQKELEEILGNDTNAKLLWNFLHSELEVTPSSRSRSVRKP